MNKIIDKDLNRIPDFKIVNGLIWKAVDVLNVKFMLFVLFASNYKK